LSERILVTRRLTKRYHRKTALDGLDLEVPRGVICGLIGPNGAGKTTAFGVVAGLIRPDAGEVDVFGDGAFDPDRHGGRLGLLPQDAEFSRDTSVRALLTYCGRLGGLGRASAAREADRVLDAVDLADRAGARVNQLSHGMRRRLQVAQALIGEPELVLLDEPMSGLDPELVVRMRELLLARAGNCTLVISSHNLLELEAICDHVIFIQAGRSVRQGPLAEVTGSGVFMRYELERPFGLEALERELSEFTLSWEGRTLVVQARASRTPAEVNAVVLAALLGSGARIVSVKSGRSLEKAYLESRGS